MHEKNKCCFKKYLFGFILGIIFFTGIIVYAAVTFSSNEVSFDNSANGFVSNNVNDAIDELYMTCKKSINIGGILAEPVADGDGLYEDRYEEGKYTYKGANPNNYVTFNNEKAGWRIISIEKNGTIKLLKNESVINNLWNSPSSNDWSKPAELNTYLNSDYYNSLTSMAQSQIVTHDFSIGAVKENDNNDMAGQINDENSEKWNGKIALVTASEYIRANSNISKCGSLEYLNDYASTCNNTNWMFNADDWWTLSPINDSSSDVHLIYSQGVMSRGTVNYSSHAVRPVVCLSSDVKIIGGIGTKSNPYKIG